MLCIVGIQCFKLVCFFNFLIISLTYIYENVAGGLDSTSASLKPCLLFQFTLGLLLALASSDPPS